MRRPAAAAPRPIAAAKYSIPDRPQRAPTTRVPPAPPLSVAASLRVQRGNDSTMPMSASVLTRAQARPCATMRAAAHSAPPLPVAAPLTRSSRPSLGVAVRRAVPAAARPAERAGPQRRGELLLAKNSAAAAAVPAEAEPEGISEGMAAANVAKSILGAGAFALPWAFVKTGLTFTVGYMVASAVLCVYCISLMQRSREMALLTKPEMAGRTGSYAGLATAALGPLGGRLTEATVMICVFGISSAFMVFVGATLATILQPPVMAQAISQNTLVWAITPLLVLLGWVRNMAGVSLISMLGNVSVLTGLVAVVCYALQLPSQLSAIPQVNFSGFGQAFGSVAFLYFVHFTLPPIEGSMARPERFLSAATTGFAFSTIVCVLFGVIGAVYFGPEVQSVVLAMLQGQGIVIAVKLLLCLNLLCTFPVVVSGAFQILEGQFKESTGKDMPGPMVYVMRAMFVVLAAAVGVGIPSFGKLLGLVGGVCCTLLTMIFPPLMMLASSARAGKPVAPLEKGLLYAILAGGLGICYLSIAG
eukprot:jgi/Tetstr1/447931/TSEL_035238.t1